MNKKTIILGVVLVLSLISIGVYLLFFFNMFDTNFATEATLRFSVRDNVTGIFTHYEFPITDDEDIIELKKIFRGRAVRDSPSCGFSTTVSITMYGEEESLTFSPALDGCPIVQVGNDRQFMAIDYYQRAILDEIFKRFGLTFPAV